MHLTSVEHGAMGSYAIVGAHLPIALGAAWSAQYRESGQVAVCFFGDGTTNIGAFHEALNMAAVWKAPVVFVCENNQYMEYTPIGDVTAVEHPAADRAAAYGLESIVVDGNDVDAVFEVAQTAVDRARAGDGPSLIEAAHLPARRPLAGRSGQVPARRRGGRLEGARPDPDLPGAARGGRRATAATLDAIEAETRDAVAAAEAEARAAPGAGRRGARDPGLGRRRLVVAELTYRAAIAAGIAQEMRRDPSVVLIGEDVGAAGGVFKLTEGLFDEFGPTRVRDTPISEQAIVGAAMGAAMTGLRPIAELMFSDFFAVTWDMVVNQIAKTRYMTDGQVSLPLVLRTANGAGLRFGAQHSQSVENWAMAIPGLKVVAPSTPADVVGLMAAAVRDPDPVIFCEHKALFAIKGEVPDGEVVDTLGTARIVRTGLGRDDRRARGDGPQGASRPPSGWPPSTASTPRSSTCARSSRSTRRRSSPRSRRPAGCSRSRRTRGCAAGARRSRRSWPTRASTASTRRSSGSRRRTSRCRRRPRSRISPSRRSSASSRRCARRLADAA